MQSTRPPLAHLFGLACAWVAPAWLIPTWTWPVRLTALTILVVLVVRLRQRQPIGIPATAGAMALGGSAAFACAWWWGSPWLFATAEAMRARLPFAPEVLMRALPGNDPLWAVAPLGGVTLQAWWITIYLGGWITVPLLAAAWFAVRSQREAVIRITWSHLTCCLIALPVFALLPIPDPWWDRGWLGGLRAPPWWAGIADQVVTCAFPSMHIAVGTAVLLAAWRVESRAWVRAAWSAWLVLVTASTLALATHWLVDLPAGAAVGWACDRLWTRLLGRCPPPSI